MRLWSSHFDSLSSWRRSWISSCISWTSAWFDRKITLVAFWSSERISSQELAMTQSMAQDHWRRPNSKGHRKSALAWNCWKANFNDGDMISIDSNGEKFDLSKNDACSGHSASSLKVTMWKSIAARNLCSGSNHYFWKRYSEQLHPAWCAFWRSLECLKAASWLVQPFIIGTNPQKFNHMRQ